MNAVAPLSDAEARKGGVPVVVFPHAGGSPRFFLHWTGVIPKARLYGVTYPGRDTRLQERHEDLPHGDSLVGLARSAADDITAAGLAGPDGPGGAGPVLVGHSMGALVAYETAAALAARGVHGVRVVASGQNPPTHRVGTALHRDTDEHLIADIVRQNPASADLWQVPELRAMFLPVVREDYRLLETYECTGAVVPDIRVVFGDRDGEVDPVRIGEWNDFSAVQRAPVRCAGGHFYLRAPDTRLAELVRAVCAEPGSGAPTGAAHGGVRR
ncbi:thioesterase domain-containing protein [Streptomyces sp. CT34]|uniref:thioesterase II family protein n=1 Tax=Streptomyces sp. CT34 TaxID=1553907 RepID=UPI000691E1E8|nr:thioesterase domain-containing protein [Streptomyces sp. CT34]